MPAKTPKSKIKSKPARKYYIHSQCLASNELPDVVKELLHKERASYRRTVPTVILEKDDLKNCHEITKHVEKIKQVDKEGNISEIDIDMTSYDFESWRYYLQPAGLQDIEDFLFDLGMKVSFSFFNPETSDDDEIGELEQNLGMPTPEEQCIILNVHDAYLFNEECGDPGCDCHPEEGN